MANPNVFTAQPEDHFKFFKGNRVKTKDVIDTLELQKKEVARASGIELNSVRYDRVPKKLEEKSFEWALIINLVYSYFKNEDKTLLWLSTPNPLLGYIPPKDMIIFGRSKKLLRFIYNAFEDNKK